MMANAKPMIPARPALQLSREGGPVRFAPATKIGARSTTYAVPKGTGKPTNLGAICGPMK